MASSRATRVGGSCVVSARGGTACAGEAGGAGVGVCWASTQRGRAKSAVANAVPFFIMLILLYGPRRWDGSLQLWWKGLNGQKRRTTEPEAREERFGAGLLQREREFSRKLRSGRLSERRPDRESRS